MPPAPPTPAEAFVRRWETSAAAERANYQLFLSELCDLLEVPRPDPAGPDDHANTYVFERAVTFYNPDGTTSPAAKRGIAEGSTIGGACSLSGQRLHPKETCHA